ncbi:MAG: 4-hydroxy-tetrahydrodipicolinate synthase [Clostridia bacterium]|nr:4-hydroxy-tetrahydrodipicolinate synthase [Clostridia bacterium]
MKKCIFEGCATAIVTPMHADGSVNEQRFKELVEQQIQGGIDALVVCGTTGESAVLNHEEHVRVIELAIQQNAGRVPIIAGTGSNDTAYGVELSKEAISLGADALLMVTPYYNKTSQAGLVAHYNYIADHVDAPIIVYNVPSRTGVNIKPETYLELAKHPNIVAAKEANGDISSVLKTISLCGDNLTIYSGNDDQTVPMMSLGAKGVISVISNILPTEFHNLTAACLAGDFKKATEMSVKYSDLMDYMFIDVNPIPVKEAMNLMGMNMGECRLPLVPMSDKNREILKNELVKHGLL